MTGSYLKSIRSQQSGLGRLHFQFDGSERTIANVDFSTTTAKEVGTVWQRNHDDGISLIRIAAGKVTEHWVTWDTLGMMQQLGAVPLLGQAVGQTAETGPSSPKR